HRRLLLAHPCAWPRPSTGRREWTSLAQKLVILERCFIGRRLTLLVASSGGWPKARQWRRRPVRIGAPRGKGPQQIACDALPLAFAAAPAPGLSSLGFFPFLRCALIWQPSGRTWMCLSVRLHLAARYLLGRPRVFGHRGEPLLSVRLPHPRS